MPQLELVGRPGKILARFPAFMRAASPGKVLGTVALSLGRDLDEAERLVTCIQRSHRLPVADEARDVLRLGALLDLEPADFFLLERLYGRGYFAEQVVAAVDGGGEPPLSDLERERRAYAAYLSEMKDLVSRMVSVMLEGCGTVWALLEGASILLDADRLDERGEVTTETRAVDHLDEGLPRGGFVHRMRVRHHVIVDGTPAERDGAIYLVENPIVDRSTEDKERRQRESFPVARGGFFDGPVTIQVTGAGGRTVKPMLIDRTSHDGVGYDGVVPDGKILVFASDGKVLLDGVDVTAKAFYLRGALATDPRSGAGPPGRPLAADSTFDGGRPVDIAVVTEPGHALDRDQPHPTMVPQDTIPVAVLKLGESHWRFSVEEGAFDASRWDEAVYRLPSDPDALAALPPSGKVKLSWKENEPFAASVLIPADLRLLEDEVLLNQDLTTLVRAGLERFRAAGIRLDVRYFDEQWILGASVLRELHAAPGPGVDFDATIPASDPERRHPS